MKEIACLLFLVPVIYFSQKRQNEKFSIDFSTGYYSNFKKWKENGPIGGVEFSYPYKSLTYSANIWFGFGISTNAETRDGYIQAFLESDLLVGKKFSLSNSISIMPQVGIGYLYYTNHFQEDPKNVLGLPIQAKILFFDDKRIAIGLIPHVILNNTQNNFSLNFTLNVKF